MSIEEGIGVLIVLIGVASPLIVVGLFYYLKKRLDHKQVLAAIAKGIAPPEAIPVRPVHVGPAWIRYVSAGIGVAIIALGCRVSQAPENVVTFVLAGIGATLLICGLWERKYYMKTRAPV